MKKTKEVNMMRLSWLTFGTKTANIIRSVHREPNPAALSLVKALQHSCSSRSVPQKKRGDGMLVVFLKSTWQGGEFGS